MILVPQSDNFNTEKLKLKNSVLENAMLPGFIFCRPYLSARK